MNMTKYEQIEYFRSRVGHLFILKPVPISKNDKALLCVLRGGFAMNLGFALTLEAIGWSGHVCARRDFSLFGQISDNEMHESKFFYTFPEQVIEITND